MSKFDKNLLRILSADSRFDSKIVKTLGVKDKTTALVKVRNPLQLITIERRFRVVGEYPFIRSLAVECGLDEAIALERMAEVEYVSGESRVSCLAGGDKDENSVFSNTSQNSFEKSEGNPQNASLNTASAFSVKGTKLTGKGTTLCVMDTGVLPHSDLSIPRERIVHFVDMIGGEKSPYDDNGHGTFVAGIAAGNGLLSGREVCGVAREANIIGLKVIGKDGESGTFKILDGMQWLFDNFRQYGVSVVCMSFGADPLDFADPLKIGAEMLARSGLIVVAASGNSGENNLKSPAISNEIISVGAVNDEGKVAEFTSRGVYNGIYRPDVYSNGVSVRGIKAGSTYSTMTGTSASAPYIAGACLLLKEKYKNLSPEQAKSMILSSAKNIDGNLVLDLDL
ncbi:MAG: S8 family serine peptidase [Clostridia bacterium]|nr:S8 family serine peptidase [Clostridia bacterium]